MKQIEGFPKTIELLPKVSEEMIVYRAKVVVVRTIEKISKHYTISVSEMDSNSIQCLLYKGKISSNSLIGHVLNKEPRYNIPDHHITMMLDVDKRTVTFLMPNNYELYVDEFVITNYGDFRKDESII